MATYKAPVEDVRFLLNDVLGYERYSNLVGFADAPADMVGAGFRLLMKKWWTSSAPTNQTAPRNSEGSRSTASTASTTMLEAA